jgi:hypothetical protein
MDEKQVARVVKILSNKFPGHKLELDLVVAGYAGRASILPSAKFIDSLLFWFNVTFRSIGLGCTAGLVIS